MSSDKGSVTAASFLESWFDWAMVGITVSAVLLQLYVIVLAIRVSPKSMHDYRLFICASTVKT
jgi:hypothetical protein